MTENRKEGTALKLLLTSVKCLKIKLDLRDVYNFLIGQGAQCLTLRQLAEEGADGRGVGGLKTHFS